MSLQFILGSAGSGKTTYLYRQLIKASLEEPDRTHILIVPEQFTLHSSAELIAMHPRHGLLNIEVLSFNRLAYRIFEKTGALQEDILTETGKNLLLRRAAFSVADRLTVMAGRMDRQGYISEIKSLLSEFAQYEISDEQVAQMIGAADPAGELCWKLKDIRTLRQAFDSIRQGRYRMAEEVPGLFAEAAAEARILQGSRIYLDDFTGFTPVQLTALRAVLRLAEEVTVTVTIDPGTELYGTIREHELFALSRKTVQQLSLLAKECEAQIDPPVWIDGAQGRFAHNAALAWLERNLLRPGRRVNLSEELPVSLHISSDPAGEAVFAASTALSLIQEKGYRCSEIAVICGDLATYQPYLVRAMDDCLLPCFIDRKISAPLDPCLEFLRAAMEVMQKSFSFESMMRFLRTGMTSLSTQQIDRMENYLLMAGIRSRKRWQEKWEPVAGEPDEEQMESLNRDRAYLMEKMDPFVRGFAGGRHTVREYADAVQKLLTSFSVEEKLQQCQEELLDTQGHPMLLAGSDRLEKAMEYGRIYPALMQVLDEEREILGQDRVSVREFAQILEAGLEEISIGVLPPGTDQIFIGDMMRTRLTHIRALIFVGMNDGWIPYRNVKPGILSETDRDFLREQGITLSPSLREDAYTQRFYLYLCLTRASERLYLSCARSDGKGAALRPSYLISSLKHMFPRLSFTDEDDRAADWRNAASENRLKTILAQEMHRPGFSDGTDPDLRGLVRLLQNEPDSAMKGHVGRIFEAAAYSLDIPALSEEAAAGLYSDAPSLSVSRADTFASCPFRYFAGYGLLLGERKELQVRPTDTGTLFHEALERFSGKVSDSPDLNWHEMPEETRRKLVNESFDEALAGQQMLYDDSRRNRYAADQVRDILQTTVWGIMEQIGAGSFEPTMFEKEFLDGSLRGKIDRIDLAFSEDKKTIWVKVIDYKSGSTKFDLPYIYDGRQMQLPIYLNQTISQLKEQYPDSTVVPAGVYYTHLQQPVLTESDVSASDAFYDDPAAVRERSEKLLMAVRPDGLTNISPEILPLFADDPEKRGLFVPLPVFNKDGSLKKGSFAVYTGQLEALYRFTGRKLEEFSGRIAGGEIALMPYADTQRYVCEYCAYHDVCGYEKRLPGSGVRRKCTLSRQEIIDQIMKEEQS